MSLNKGQWVRIKNHEIFGTVIGPRQGDAGLPEEQTHYKIDVVPQDTYYCLASDLEVIAEPEPERVSLKERYARFNEIAAKLLASNPPYDQNQVKAFLESWKNLREEHRDGSASRKPAAK